MPAFRAADGTELAYRVDGEGAPLVCLPGGPMRASGYLGDLGGLSARRQLIRLDLRRTGRSAIPADPASYRCDRLVDDVAALQDHLALNRVDLLAHSAGANLAAAAFGAEGAFDPVSTRAALAAFGAPVLVLAGGVDLQRPPRIAAEFAALFPAARLVVQPEAGHYPWLDDAGWFVAAVTAFLDQGP